MYLVSADEDILDATKSKPRQQPRKQKPAQKREVLAERQMNQEGFELNRSILRLEIHMNFIVIFSFLLVSYEPEISN